MDLPVSVHEILNFRLQLYILFPILHTYELVQTLVLLFPNYIYPHKYFFINKYYFNMFFFTSED